MTTIYLWSAVASVGPIALTLMMLLTALAVLLLCAHFCDVQLRKRHASPHDGETPRFTVLHKTITYGIHGTWSADSRNGMGKPASLDAYSQSYSYSFSYTCPYPYGASYTGLYRVPDVHSDLGVDPDPDRMPTACNDNGTACEAYEAEDTERGGVFCMYQDQVMKTGRRHVTTMVIRNPDFSQVDTLTWVPDDGYRRCAKERRRIQLFRQSEEFADIADGIDRSYDDGVKAGGSVGGLFQMDRHSVAAHKFVSTGLALGAKAALKQFDGPVGLLTVNLAACCDLKSWLKLGGAHPNEMCDEFWRELMHCARELGVAYMFIDAFFEVDVNSTYDVSSRHGIFVKSWVYAHWKRVHAPFHGRPVFVPHYHCTIALMGEDGTAMALEPLAERLRKKYSAYRQVNLRLVKAGDDPSVEIKAYALKDAAEQSDALVLEEARWRDALDVEHLVASAWFKLTRGRLSANKRVLRSVVFRDRVRDAIVNFDIGPSLVEAWKRRSAAIIPFPAGQTSAPSAIANLQGRANGTASAVGPPHNATICLHACVTIP
jgi:hypothetical protein